MKKLFFFFLVLLLTQSIWAQNNRLRYSLKAGISVGKIAIRPPLQNRTEHYRMGVAGGGVVEIPVQQKLNVQIEALYHLHRSSLKFDPYTDAKAFDLTLHQLSLPVQVGYFITPKWNIHAGGSANYNFYCTNKVTVEFGAHPTLNITDEITRFQPGVLGGITFYASNNALVEGRYHRMLTNAYKRPTGDNRTEYHLGFFQVAFGYGF
jgi:hypothetical protein